MYFRSKQDTGFTGFGNGNQKCDVRLDEADQNPLILYLITVHDVTFYDVLCGTEVYVGLRRYLDTFGSRRKHVPQ